MIWEVERNTREESHKRTKKYCGTCRMIVFLVREAFTDSSPLLRMERKCYTQLTGVCSCVSLSINVSTHKYSKNRSEP